MTGGFISKEDRDTMYSHSNTEEQNKNCLPEKEAGTGAMQPQAKEYTGLQELREGRKDCSLDDSERAHTILPSP